MANSDKNIIITPFISGVTQPQMKFVGQGNDPIYLKVLDGITGTGATAGGALSVEGSAGQLFSIVNRLGTGSIFSVNDISGIPIIDANASGDISLAGYFGNVGVGLTAPTEKFQVTGNAFVSGLVTAVSGISAAGSTFSSTTNTIDVIASTNGAGLRIAKATTGADSRIGGIRLGRNATSSLNTYLEGSSGTFTIYNGVDTTGSKIVDFTATATGFSGDVTATGLISAVKGISAAGGVTLAGTFSGATGSFSKLLTLSGGLSAAGATFSGSVFTDNIFSINSQLSLNDKQNTRVSIGDFSANGNLTYIYLRDNVSILEISNPYGDIKIGDPSAVDSGYFITYNAANGYLDGNGSALTNFSSGSFNQLLTTSAGISAAGTTAANFNGLVDMSFNTLFEPTLRYYNEPVSNPTITGNALTLDLSAAQVFGVTLNSPINTFTISNTPATANRSIGFTLILTADGTARGVTWGSSVKWSGAVSPTLTSTNGKKDILTFLTINGGTEWLGFIAGQNF
jgi:hypothetical protein